MQDRKYTVHRQVLARSRCAALRDTTAWRRECVLAGVLLLLLALALFGPPMAQPLHYHDFADQRAWGALPHAMDVLSNLPFAIGGVMGLQALARAVRLQAVNDAVAGLAGLFFGGLLVTAGVSAAYHLRPDDAGLVWDRLGMVLAFAGLLGLAAMQAVSLRAGVALALAVLVLGPLSVHLGSVSGNVLPWAVLQGGGMVLIAGFAWWPGRAAPALPIRWMLVMAVYALAKALELGDPLVFEGTGHLVSGHSLKHVVASCAAWPLVAALRASRRIRAESSAAFQARAGRPATRVPEAAAPPLKKRNQA